MWGIGRIGGKGFDPLAGLRPFSKASSTPGSGSFTTRPFEGARGLIACLHDLIHARGKRPSPKTSPIEEEGFDAFFLGMISGHYFG